MKKLLKAYSSFTSTERKGIIGLLLVMVVLVGVRAAMHFFVQPTVNSGKEKELVAAWNHYNKQQGVDTGVAADHVVYTANTVINLNTADSEALVSLKGIGPKRAHQILERRRTKGLFTSYEQLLDIYHFPDATFQELKKQLVIK